ncbi:serine carboxypeptidase [Neolentinus lepideus HHB14362 ss-1]|uniref:Carboxypeptidase n=1 Tax=Neolentinus lepideus HHB14362 ss-1 TaxID=1314782 RepID=A0A165RWW8_9AGAM|nr:serine carboxypeptidase [Neolentinus lepideus HHB14362 ss-1]
MKTAFLLASVCLVAASHVQQPLHKPYDAALGQYEPLGTLDALSETAFAVLRHPAFGAHAVRVKRSDFCDGGVAAYTGYVDTGARHLFFYFFESRGAPDEDDVVLWMNGGPGCSSSMGLFMELGPCRVTSSNTTAYHPEAWNEKANVFFIDQPVNTGFSYAEYGEGVTRSEDAAKDIAAFLAIFFAHFPRFQGRAVHLAGESYAGRMVPVFASEIYDQNARLLRDGLTPINLTSIMLGNGQTDIFSMTLSFYDMTCTAASLPPVLPISTCVRIKQAVPRCEKMMREACVDRFDSISCEDAVAVCRAEIGFPYVATGGNPYDISKKCEGEYDDTMCYPLTKDIAAFLNLPSTRAALGVDPAVPSFASCNYDILNAFARADDALAPPFTTDYVAGLLERGVRVLVYAGSVDFICNWVGNAAWVEKLEWSGGEAYRGQEMRGWDVGGRAAGLTKGAEGLRFVSIYGGGHMAPYDRPKEALEMVKRWLADEPF